MRKSTITRKTSETDIQLSLCLDGGSISINTGIGFFDHMLHAFAMHAGMGLQIEAKGDLYVDAHHTVEDVGIVLGDALKEAIGSKAGIARYGTFTIPMDESLAFVSLDISGRPFLVFDAVFEEQMVGAMDTCLVEEFMRALAMHAGITLHCKVIYGTNAHHKIEALFKALAHALRIACSQNGDTLLSTKGALE